MAPPHPIAGFVPKNAKSIDRRAFHPHQRGAAVLRIRGGTCGSRRRPRGLGPIFRGSGVGRTAAAAVSTQIAANGSSRI
jgi:hypothetical protein